jgi:hypothetical protein
MTILRFPNPGSDIRKFIETYCILYENLKNKSNFTHDDAVKVLITNGLASSSGAIGQEALKRSTRDDRSRDPLYNQHKMYSELYRMLGWYKPGSKRTNFDFTELSGYIFEAEEKIKNNIFTECVLNITFPNYLVNNISGNRIKPFIFLLKLMNELDDVMFRDEIILSVLTTSNDKTKDILNNQKELVINLRTNYNKLCSSFKKLGKLETIQENTLRNYTRFVLGALSYCGWAESESNKSIYGKSLICYKLTDEGKNLVSKLSQFVDIRHEEIIGTPLKERAAFTLITHYNFLERVGYKLDDVSEVVNKLVLINKELFDKFKIINRTNILYSPIQQSTDEEIKSATELETELEK